MALRLHTIICSTRPGRVGAGVARWFQATAEKSGLFEAELVDLAEFSLPVYDEPHHPVTQNYQQEHTKRWAASVAAADAYVFVTPEYNHGPPPSLINALNYVYKEWNYKPAGIVSYGGVSGGMRAAHLLKPTLCTLKMVPLVEAVAVQNVSQQVDELRNFIPTDSHSRSAEVLLKELARWAEALKPLHG